MFLLELNWHCDNWWLQKYCNELNRHFGVFPRPRRSLKSDFGKFFLTLQKRVQWTCDLCGILIQSMRIYCKIRWDVHGNGIVNEKRMWWLGTTSFLLHIVLTLVAQVNHYPKDAMRYNTYRMNQFNWDADGEYMEVTVWCWRGVKNVIILYHFQGSLCGLHSIVGAHYMF